MLVCYKSDDLNILKASAELFNTIFSMESQKKYAEEAKQIPAVAGEYNMLEPLKLIMDYPEDRSFVESGVQKFTNEYEDIFYETVSAASMNDTLNADSLCDELDKQFSVLIK